MQAELSPHELLVVGLKTDEEAVTDGWEWRLVLSIQSQELVVARVDHYLLLPGVLLLFGVLELLVVVSVA